MLAQGGQHSILCRQQPVLCGQKRRIAQRLGRGIAGGIGGKRQHLPHQIAVAIAFMRARHQGHQAGIARAGAKGGAQRHDGIAGLVLVNQPACFQLQRLNLIRVVDQNLVHQSAGPHPIAGLQPHLRQSDFQIAGLLIGLCALYQGFHIRNGALLVAVIEIKPRTNAPQKRQIRSPRKDHPVQFGTCGGCAAQFGQKPDQQDFLIGCFRGGIYPAADMRFGGVQVVLINIPPH